MKIVPKATAKALGLFRYFTGKPCNRGHLSERYVSTGQCHACLLLVNRSWKKRNKAKCTAWSRAWQERNREKVRELKRGYYRDSAQEREAQAIRSRRWMEANREKYRASSAKWRKSHLAMAAAAQQRRRAKLLKRMPSWANHDAIRQFYIRARELTDQTGVEHHVDHIYPLQGELVSGLHIESNLQILPRWENQSKGARLLEGWSMKGSQDHGL